MVYCWNIARLLWWVQQHLCGVHLFIPFPPTYSLKLPVVSEVSVTPFFHVQDKVDGFRVFRCNMHHLYINRTCVRGRHTFTCVVRARVLFVVYVAGGFGGIAEKDEV